jgi:tRNA(fMet)-specific endonuclease VapC
MRYFLLDTNFVFIQLRDSARLQSFTIAHRLDEDDALLMVSVVTVAELYSLAKRNNWGEKRMIALQTTLQRLYTVDIQRSNQVLINAYVDIDSYSQRIGRKMSKNDLWIAATAAVANATLITSDGDFEHLDGQIALIKTTVN